MPVTERLFREDPYQKDADASVVRITPEGGIVTDQTVFYATGGGQPGDSGKMIWGSDVLEIASAVNTGQGDIAHVPAAMDRMPDVGTTVRLSLDWDRRYRHMRVHTALHLLSVVVPLPVTGGSISAQKGRLDFDMPEAPEDREALEQALHDLIEEDFEVTEEWITDAELIANPGLVKTMSVKPPMGAGQVRLIRIGDRDRQIDLQPCGGTHVARTGEIGAIRLGKIEKKGRENRRINILLDR